MHRLCISIRRASKEENSRSIETFGIAQLSFGLKSKILHTCDYIRWGNKEVYPNPVSSPRNLFMPTCRPPTLDDIPILKVIVIALKRHSSDSASDLDRSMLVSTLHLALASCFCFSCCSSWRINTTSTPYVATFQSLYLFFLFKSLT